MAKPNKTEANAPTELRALLDAGLAAMDAGVGAALDDAARARLIDFVVLLARWNRAYNLTAVRDPREQIPRHLLDSLAVLPWVTQGMSQGPVLDLGTGAGLPGLPLAIARPELAFTLLDSNGKKTRFVRQATIELGLSNVDVIQTRLETYRPAHKFATIVARALAALPDLVAGAEPLAAPGGRLLALKGRLAEQELAALRASATGAESTHHHPIKVPGIEGERALIEVAFGSSTHG